MTNWRQSDNVYTLQNTITLRNTTGSTTCSHDFVIIRNENRSDFSPIKKAKIFRFEK